MAQNFRPAIILLLILAFSHPAFGGVAVLGPPSWVDLSPKQKQILAPLAVEWDRMEELRQRKWLGIAERYTTMTPEEQARVQKRVQAWARLSPEERRKAREQFKSLQKDPPEKKEELKQKWQKYESLPEEEKQRLKEVASQLPRPADAGKKAAPAAKADTAAKPEAAPASTGAPVSAPAGNPARQP